MLFLDGILLILGGRWAARPGLVGFGAVLIAGGFGVIWLWRRWGRELAGIDEARRQLKRERDALKRLLERLPSDR